MCGQPSVVVELAVFDIQHSVVGCVDSLVLL